MPTKGNFIKFSVYLENQEEGDMICNRVRIIARISLPSSPLIMRSLNKISGIFVRY